MLHIVQLLCPERHCIMGTAFDDRDMTFEEAKSGIQEFMRAANVNSWCGICGSHKLTFEMAKLKYDTMEEAAMHLAKAEIENILTRIKLDSEGKSFDSQGRN